MNGDSSKRHAELFGIFERVLELDSQQRTCFLGELEVQDPQLWKSLLALLDRHNCPEHMRVLGTPLPGELEIPTGEVGLPEYIGRYRLIELIGHGGMGSVWLAEQEQPVQRRVALKVIQQSVTSTAAQGRFEVERRILARMEHPSIARLLDAGSMPDGRPWFAMELVNGDPIDEWCEHHGLHLESRLELFREVCSAVEHAHRRGTVHLDIKASNILVQATDGRVQVKLIDFGIAQALGADRTVLGAEGDSGRWGSASSMSPEQAESSAVDVRSDVYSLGLLLHRLLTGDCSEGTLELDGLPFEQVAERLRKGERPSLSQVVECSQDPLPLGVPRSKLIRQLRRELDAVVGAATRPDAADRYPTVDALSEDLRRFLSHEALSVVPGHWSYRLLKAYRRQRLRFIALGAMLVFLVGGAALASVGYVFARHERDLARDAEAAAEQASLAAQSESARARTMTSFLVDTLRLADPRVTLGASMSMRDLLDVTSQRLDDTLDPQSEATLRATIGQAYRSLGEDALARDQLTQAVRLLQEDPGTPRLELYRAAWSLFLVHDKESRREAFEVLVPVVYLRTALLTEFDSELAERMQAMLYPVLESEFHQALVDLPAAIASAEVRHSKQHVMWPVVADELTDLGTLLIRGHSDERALILIEQAQRILVNHLPTGHPDLARLEFLRAALWVDGGHFERARARLVPVLQILEQALPPEHWRIHQARSLLGQCLVGLGRREEGVLWMQKAATALEDDASPGFSARVDAQLRLLDALALEESSHSVEVRRSALAEGLSTRPIGTLWWGLYPSLFGPPGFPMRIRLGKLLKRCGPLAKASDENPGLAALEDLRAIAEVELLASGPSQRLLGRVLMEAANTLTPECPELREALARQAFVFLSPHQTSQSLHFADACGLLAELELERGSYDEAESLATRAQRIYLIRLGEHSASTRDVSRTLQLSRARGAALGFPHVDHGASNFVR